MKKFGKSGIKDFMPVFDCFAFPVFSISFVNDIIKNYWTTLGLLDTWV